MANGWRFPYRPIPSRARRGRGTARPASACRASKPVGSQAREVPPGDDRGARARRGSAATERAGPGGQEKPLARGTVPVPQTDTGGPVEYTEVDEGTCVKELGKLAP